MSTPYSKQLSFNIYQMKSFSRYAVFAMLVMLNALWCMAEIPSGYYNALNGKKDAELKTAAYNIIRNFTSVSSYNNLPSYFRRTDVRPNTDYWWDMYSDMDVDIYIQFGTYMNREHSFPKSWWGSTTSTATNYKAYTDLNHLYPGEAKANQAKSNYPLGEVRTANKFDNGVTKVGSPVSGQGGGAAYVFEPDDEYKGDFARTYFYMVTCYQDYTWAKSYMYMLQQNVYPTLNQWSIDMLLKWARMDEVSDKERQRNEAVYKIQNNRNPFIDFPELAEYIWGNKKGEVFSVSSEVTPPAGKAILLAPVPNTAVDFGQVAVGGTATAKLFIHGENMKTPLTLVLFDADKSKFELASSSVAASLVNRSEGYWLTLKYKPTEIGEHECRLQIISDDLDSAPPVVTLRGECLEKPVLTACTALDPSDITSDEYSANWSTPEGEVVDYWIITRTKYVNGQSTTEEIMAESSPWTITGFNESDYETYAVQSVRLNERSPMSNTVVVSHSGISGVEVEKPLTVSGYDGMIRFECADRQTSCRIFDLSGREIMYIDAIELDMEIPMPRGIYFVVTDQHPTPVKVAVR